MHLKDLVETMQRKVIISCAVTGSADTPGRNPAVPVTPEQIATSAIDAAKAGAAIVHIHVRDPKTTKPSMDTALYREVVERIRGSGTDVLINLTTGPGARFTHDEGDPSKPGPESVLKSPEQRVRHVVELKPDICSLDMGSLNMGDRVFINTPKHLQAMAVAIKDAGVMPELEVFETGHLLLAKRFIENGYVKPPGMFQICLGISWGQPATLYAQSVAIGGTVVRLRYFAASIPDGGANRAARRPSARRARGQHLSGKGQARAEQRGAGRKGGEHYRNPWRPGRDAGGSAANPRSDSEQRLNHAIKGASIMDLGIKGLRVIVTAGAAGIGREVARAFLREGALVHICDVDRTALAELASSDPKVKASLCDVSDRDAVTRFIDATADALGGLDCLINSAGIAGPTGRVDEIPPEEWDRTLAVNITGQFNCVRAALRHLAKSGNPSIINLSSTAGRLGFPLRTPYAASKWAVVGFTKSLAIELGPLKIRVNAIQPGAVEGDRIRRVFGAKAQVRGVSMQAIQEEALSHASIKEMIAPQQLADMMVFLASPRGRTISGQAISICGDVQSLF
jgi:uncharacterized protein (DUF849 family)/NAD(P)-dependent dehydrogenase (short-subunit alcohol dehydrogenase family)